MKVATALDLAVIGLLLLGCALAVSVTVTGPHLGGMERVVTGALGVALTWLTALRVARLSRRPT